MQEFSNEQTITYFYKNMEPTAKKVVALFKDVNTTDNAERESLSYLKGTFAV